MSARTMCDGPDCDRERRGDRYGATYDDGVAADYHRRAWLVVEHNEDCLHGDFCSFECLAAWAMNHAIDRQDTT